MAVVKRSWGVGAVCRRCTFYGIIAVLIWSTGGAFCHALTESWGLLSGAMVNLIAGVIGVGFQHRRHGWRFLKGRSRRCWLTCGLLYMIYVTANYASSLFAVSREQAVALTLIKSTWPLLAYIFLFLLQKRRMDSRFMVKTAMLTAGLLLSNLMGEDGSVVNLRLLFDCLPAICIGLVSSVAWAAYSNAIGLFDAAEEGGQGDCTGVFMIVTAFAVAALSLADRKPHSFSLGGSFWFQLLFNSVIGVLLANVLWNQAVLHGDRAKVFSFSNLLPVLSVFMSAAILRVGVSVPVFIGSVMIVIGTMISTEPAAGESRNVAIDRE